jgi:hypothetical protein
MSRKDSLLPFAPVRRLLKGQETEGGQGIVVVSVAMVALFARDHLIFC